MDVESVRSFLLVASEGSYARAAPQLHRSVSALSRRIQELERELGVELFKRTSRGIRLSERGRELRERAQRLVDVADALVSDAHQKERLSGIRIGISPALKSSVQSQLIEALRSCGLDTVVLIPGQNTQLIRKLLTDQLDIALSHEQPQSDRLTSRLIGEQPTKIMVGADTALASRTPLLLQDLAGLPFVTSARYLSGAPIYYARLCSILAEAGADEIVHVPDLFRVSEIVANGSGFGIWVGREETSDEPQFSPEGVVVRHAEGFGFPLPTYLVYQSPATWLTEEVRAALGEYLPSIQTTRSR